MGGGNPTGSLSLASLERQSVNYAFKYKIQSISILGTRKEHLLLPGSSSGYNIKILSPVVLAPKDNTLISLCSLNKLMAPA